MYLRDYIFVTDVSVPAVETIKLARVQTGVSETVSFLKTFGYLYDAFEIGEKGNTEGRERGCRQSLYRGKKKTSDDAGGKPTRGFSLQILSCLC